jgi:hypothetical protein
MQLRHTVIIVASIFAAGSAQAADYSPHVGKPIPTRVLFGDTHLHTAYSTDAGMIGNRLGPEDAYRFALGEQITSSTGVKARLARPLDFLVISDHAENLGLAPAIMESNPALLASEWGKTVHDEVRTGTVAGITSAYMKWMRAMYVKTDPLAGSGLGKTYWQRLTAAAEKYNQPGRFTGLIGFEWTSSPGGNNLHRNIILRDGKDKADQFVPISAYDTEDPEKLWQWMADYERNTGGRMMAIPHNGNLSNGLMFDEVTLTDRKPLSRDYAERRMRWEPLYEVTQIKGDGETHPALSPRDEFANFERWDKGSFGTQAKTPEMLPREYAREALKRGLVHEAHLGVNPFKFGVIGSTDSHTGLSTAEANNFFGKASLLEPSANAALRFNEVIAGRDKNPEGKDIRQYAWQSLSSGIAAVWATDNTRAAIWDAMARKEVYATTGTRMEVRLFAGTDFTREDLQRGDWVANGYAKGVPMGGSLQVGAGKTATFLIKAARAPDGANLDRIQIVKGWLDKAGKTQEKVFDVAWSGQVEKTRKPGKDGKLPPVGNTVDAKNATWSNAIGAATLEASWRDPEFAPGQKAVYYVRVLEIPTPRWTTYDAKVFGTTLPKDAPVAIQNRAYTSPVWVN